MTARYTVYLRQRPGGWEWTRNPDSPWNGYYKSEGTAKNAAMRSLTRTPPTVRKDEFEFKKHPWQSQPFSV
jgi:hypothetical protein